MMSFLTYIGFGLIIVPTLMLTYLSFKQSFIWGVLCFVISPLPFSFVYWSETKKYLVMLVVGCFFIAPAFISINSFTDENLDTAATEVHRIIQRQDKTSYFSSPQIGAEVGRLVKCEDDVLLSNSFKSIDSKYPVTWVGVVSCRFTKEKADVEVIVLQLESGEWEELEINIDGEV